MTGYGLPDRSTRYCRACGADFEEKGYGWRVVTPAGAFCRYHVKSAPTV